MQKKKLPDEHSRVVKCGNCGFKKKLAKYSNNIYMQALMKIYDNPNLTVTFFCSNNQKPSHPHWERKRAANGREHN